jgi:hypothetical protein
VSRHIIDDARLSNKYLKLLDILLRHFIDDARLPSESDELKLLYIFRPFFDDDARLPNECFELLDILLRHFFDDA